MVRESRGFGRGRRCFPHSRGDGPIPWSVVVSSPEFSPLAWGWSDVFHGSGVKASVFPTRVGMVRIFWPTGSSGFRFPHSRGDGPLYTYHLQSGMRFSPLAWGWSDLTDVLENNGEVFPTRVGMVRGFRTEPCPPSSFPHSRGDGPIIAFLEKNDVLFSPLAWGWSVRSLWQPPIEIVFPTRVGMVRFR